MKKVLFLAMFAACGGSSGGVDGGLKLASLSDAEVMDECSYLVGEYPKKDFTCDNGSGGTVTVHYGYDTVATCSSDIEDEIDDIPNCPATVDDAEGCIDYIYNLSNDTFCNSEDTPAACAVLDSDDCSPPDTTNRRSDTLARGVANAHHLLAARLRK